MEHLLDHSADRYQLLHRMDGGADPIVIKHGLPFNLGPGDHNSHEYPTGYGNLAPGGFGPNAAPAFGDLGNVFWSVSDIVSYLCNWFSPSADLRHVAHHPQ